MHGVAQLMQEDVANELRWDEEQLGVQADCATLGEACTAGLLASDRGFAHLKTVLCGDGLQPREEALLRFPDHPAAQRRSPEIGRIDLPSDK